MKHFFVYLVLFCSSAFLAQANEDWVQSLDAFLSEHCYDCHDDTTDKGGLNLLDLGTDLSDAELMRKWVLVHDRVRDGEMPPKKKKRLGSNDTKSFLADLGSSLSKVDMDRKEVVLRRLNRLEYQNTMRDLFALPLLEIKDRLPEDATSHGFDTIGEALSLSTEQMLVYLEAADAVLDLALADREKPETHKSTSNLKTSSQRVINKLYRDHPEGVVMYSSDYSPSIYRGFKIDEPGLYRFHLRARPFKSDEKMIVRVYAGDVIARRGLRWLVGHYELEPTEKWTDIKFETRLEPRGSVHIYTYRNGGHEKDAKNTERPGVLVGDAECEGPIIEQWPPKSRTNLLQGIDPESATVDDAIAIFSRLLPRLYRRVTRPEEVEPFVTLTRKALSDDRPWLEALRVGLKAMMVSPEFLFLEEPDRELIGNYALATRLSYFLWKTTPDDQLLSLAAKGQLNKPEILKQQTERLLKDSRADRFVEDFTGQWLDLYDIDFTEPDRHLFPEYDGLLRAGMIAESRGFFTELLNEDLGVANFIDSDWTILNSRLAEHYGIPGVNGLEYRKVNLPAGSPRGGLLAQAAIHKVTANGTNTSPVLRGAWMLENFFGTPVPPPPPNVPAVEPDITGATSLREMLVKHSSDETCAGCHVKMDPPGFALERFDPIGGWRDWYRSMGEGERIADRFTDGPIKKARVRYKKGLDVDASGQTSRGFEFDDFNSFKSHLAENPEFMAHNVVEKLLAYSLGRGMGFSDREEIDKIVHQSKSKNYGLRSLIHAVVQSDLFTQP